MTLSHTMNKKVEAGSVWGRLLLCIKKADSRAGIRLQPFLLKRALINYYTMLVDIHFVG